VLVVGEGDFSLSLALVRRQADASNLTATSFRLFSQTRNSFPAATDTITDLVTRGATVLHNVDARSLRESDGVRDNYDLVFFAFPYAEDTHNPSDPRHADLVAQFLRSASTILRNEGEVALLLHVSDGGVAQFDSWKVASAAEAVQLTLVGDFEGLDDGIQGYVPHKGNGAIFPFQRARTYVFRRAAMGAVYGVFAQELETLWQEGIQRGDSSLTSATEFQLREIESAQQSRVDRTTTLGHNTQVAIEPDRVEPASTNFLDLCCTGNDECSACGQNEGPDGVKLPCEHRVCIDCLTQMKDLAIAQRSYRVMHCPTGIGEAASCEVIKPSWLAQHVELSGSDLLHLNDLSTGRSSGFERAADADDTSGPEMLQLLEMAQAEQWSRCACGCVIARTTGCNHITCECGEQFCYVCKCANAIDSKWVGRHYECVAPPMLPAPVLAVRQLPTAAAVPRHREGDPCPICSRIHTRNRTRRRRRGDGNNYIVNMNAHIRDAH
jgi:hypothetical protein